MMIGSTALYDVRAASGRALRECRSLGLRGLSAVPWVTQSILHLAQGNHEGLQASANRLLKRRASGLGLFYMAHSHFLNGLYDECYDSLNTFLRWNPAHPDASYLFAQLLTCELHCRPDREELAWDTLERLSALSPRRKTWLVMANLVRNKDDFGRLMSAWSKAFRAGITPRFHPDTNNYLSIGALRAQQYDMARQFWRETIAAVTKSDRAPRKASPRKRFTPSHAAIALADITEALKRNDIPSFLVSGTLLGCVREGQLLGHDKDIDIGVWEDISRTRLLRAISGSGQFYIQASRAPETIRLKHVNGTAIDVFYHFRENGRIWHGGVKARWYNSAFDLATIDFLGGTYSIPRDYDAYLQENYGDWKTPKKIFDSVYDTPNAVVVNHEEMVIHDYRGLLHGLANGSIAQIARYGDNLILQGEQVPL